MTRLMTAMRFEASQPSRSVAVTAIIITNVELTSFVMPASPLSRRKLPIDDN